MIKIVVLQKRKPGLTREQFRDYYEKTHAPLVASLMPSMIGYRRNYPTGEGFRRDGSPAPEPDFDVITEVFYESREAQMKGLEQINDPEYLKLMTEDELNFVDQSSIRIYTVEEHETKFGES